MASDAAEQVRQGIAAAKSGQREQARSLLTRAVERDERNLMAWLWLSGLVDSLDDKEVCLENVLALDPGNEPARRGLEWVRSQKGAPRSVYVPPLISESQSISMPLTPAQAILRSRRPAPEPAPRPEPAPVSAPAGGPPAGPENEVARMLGAPLPQAQVEQVLSELDDELLCPYCAVTTQPEDKQCPACHGKLWQHRRKNPNGSTMFWFFLGYTLLNAAGSLYLFTTALTLLFGQAVATGQLTPEQFLGAYIGLGNVSPEVRQAVLTRLPPLVFWAFMLSLSIQCVELVLIYLRWKPFYWFLVGIAVLNIVLSLAQVALNPIGLGWIGFGASFIPLLFLFRIEDDFSMEHERHWCAPDRDIHTHSAYYQRGRAYARKKMWAKAAVHFRRASGGAPNVIAYHLALATAYARLKRYERAQAVLREAQRLAPDSAGVRELAELIASAQSA